MDKQEQEVLVQNQLNLMNQCYYCVQMNELCPDCIEAKEARDAAIAWDIVDEGNEQYDHVPSKKNEMPSGHDWVSNEVITKISVDKSTGLTTKTIRTELFEASSWLVDRLFDIENSITLSIHECICSVCHYTINKHAVCPNCN